MTVKPKVSQQLVVFALSGEHYALPIESVSEIIRFTAPRSVASDDPAIRGVIGLRGRIIPIFDLASRLGVISSESPSDKIMIIDGASGPIGIVVGDVEEVLTVTAEQFEEVPTATSGAIDAIARLEGDRLVLVLNVAETLGVTVTDGEPAVA